MAEKFYITTAIDYVNANPHLGHALEKIQADVLARWRRQQDGSVFFLSGTDENSLKNVQAAEVAGINVKEFVDKNAEKFQELKNSLNLSYDAFIRTTEERHFKGAQKLWTACQKDIYKKTYKGLYCVGCEEFYKESELENGLCPEHQTKPEICEEENYFFSLSKYEGRIRELIEKNEVKIIPETRKNEVLGFLDQGVQDICISRSVERAKGWGIPVPGDAAQVMWVWFDALVNYITALGYGQENEDNFKKWWQEGDGAVHVIGKGILRFHAVYWVGMLLSAGLNLPKVIFVHGYITSNGQKMSKSLGNVVDPFVLVEKYGVDAVRHFLLREIPAYEDGDFSIQKFKERYNADLAKGLGNLVSRTVTIAKKIGVSLNEKFSNSSAELQSEIDEARTVSSKNLEDFKFNEALAAIWKLVGFCDRYIEKTQPWKTKDSAAVGNLLFALMQISQIIKPFLPETSQKIMRLLAGKDIGILFPRL